MFDKISSRIPKVNMTKRMRILLKSFLITILAISAIVVIGVILLDRAVQPPPPTPLGDVRVPADPPPSNTNNISSEEDDDNEEEAWFEYVWPAPERFTDDNRRENFWTFLIIGLNEGQNSNTVMVASYCAITRKANLISIPRDVVAHPTRVGRKLLSSYLAGGVPVVQRDVMNIIGFIPDFYVVIDYDAFFAIVDAVGGIYIDVPIRMRYDDPYQNLFIDIQPGWQHMDSATALNFTRFRQANRNSGYPSLPDGDFGRVRNQQAVINAVIYRLLTPASILRIPQFVDIFTESVYTNLTYTNMMYFARELNRVIGTDSLSTYTLLPVRSGGRPHYYEFLGASNVLEIVNRTINPFDQDLELRDLNIVTQ